jgi:hypothetical protein
MLSTTQHVHTVCHWRIHTSHTRDSSYNHPSCCTAAAAPPRHIMYMLAVKIPGGPHCQPRSHTPPSLNLHDLWIANRVLLLLLLVVLPL